MMNYVVLILGMALITWTIRATVFVLGDRLVFPQLVRTALGFVPVTVLTAIIVPMAVSPHGGGAELTWRNPQLVGALAAVAVSALTRRPLLTIAVGLAVFFVWKASCSNRAHYLGCSVSLVQRRNRRCPVTEGRRALKFYPDPPLCSRGPLVGKVSPLVMRQQCRINRVEH